MVLAYVPFVNAYNDNDARKALRTTISEINDNIDNLRASAARDDEALSSRINKSLDELRTSIAKKDKDLSSRIDELQASVNELQERVDSLWEKGATNLDKTDIKANVALWITIPIVMVICGILCLAFWPRRSKAATTNSTRADQHKCPRCGWEHDPGDTVCKNPNCKTQF